MKYNIKYAYSSHAKKLESSIDCLSETDAINYALGLAIAEFDKRFFDDFVKSNPNAGDERRYYDKRSSSIYYKAELDGSDILD